MNGLTDREFDTIQDIASRAVRDRERIVRPFTDGYERLAYHVTITSDLEMVHTKIVPLDLDRFLNAPSSDFWHDLSGISQYLDRRNGTFTTIFQPRMAKEE